VAVDLPADGHLVSAGGFNAADVTVLYRWRFGALVDLQSSAAVWHIGSPGVGAMALGRNFNASTFHVYALSATNVYQGDTGNFTPNPATWHAGAARMAGTAITSWHNATKSGPFTYAGSGKTTGLNFYLNQDAFGGNHQGNFDFADVCLLHVALTDDEVAAYCKGFSGEFWARRAMSYWPLVAWEGSPVRDRRGYRDLTLSAGTAVKTDHPRMISPAEAAWP
jgi:hypothetical protein